jgi:hypothetical protein
MLESKVIRVFADLPSILRIRCPFEEGGCAAFDSEVLVAEQITRPSPPHCALVTGELVGFQGSEARGDRNMELEILP